MLTGDSNPTLARDSMFSVLMIVLTGVKGVTVIVAARVQRQGRTQPMQPEDLATVNQSGSSAYINLITTMSVLALVLPNFSQDSLEANYSLPINWLLTFVSASTEFFCGQVGRYRNLFIDNAQHQAPSLSVRQHKAEPTPQDEPQNSILQNGGLMAAGLLVLVLIAESMGTLIETGINDSACPVSGGLLVGLLVVVPEALNVCRPQGRGTQTIAQYLTAHPSQPSA